MTTVVISVGRNAGPYPMNSMQWCEFKADITHALHNHTTIILCRPTVAYGIPSSQVGTWIGTTEECAVWIAMVDEAWVDSLALAVSKIGSKHKQAEVGFIVSNGQPTTVPCT